MLTQPPQMRRRARSVTIVTHETASELARVSAALEERGVEVIVAPAWAELPVGGATYIRSIDPRLGDASSFARIATLGAHSALVVNSPACVRVAEWLPLTANALRDAGVPQPRRLWCFDHDDLRGAVAALGTNLIVEGVVSRRRAHVTSPVALHEAFDDAVRGYAERGALVEAALGGATADLSMLIVDARCLPLPGPCDGRLPLASRRRAARVATRAAATLGASVISVHVAVNQTGEAHAVRLDAAPRVDRLGCDALESVVHAIMRRVRAASLLAPAYALHRAGGPGRAACSRRKRVRAAR